MPAFAGPTGRASAISSILDVCPAGSDRRQFASRAVFDAELLRGGLRPATPAGGWAAGHLACAVVAKIGCLRPSPRVRIRHPHSGALALADFAAVVAYENRFTSQCSSRDRCLRVRMLAKTRALFLDGYLRFQHRARSARTVGNVVVAQHCLCAGMPQDSETEARGITRRMIHPNTANTIVIDLAFGIVAAENADAERIANVVSLHHRHRHLGQRQAREAMCP